MLRLKLIHVSKRVTGRWAAKILRPSDTTMVNTIYLLRSFARSYDNLTPLLWRHNERDGVSNHQPHDCLLDSLFRCRSKKTSKLRVTGLCAGNSPVTGEFPAQRASTAEMFPFDDVIMLLVRGPCPGGLYDRWKYPDLFAFYIHSPDMSSLHPSGKCACWGWRPHFDREWRWPHGHNQFRPCDSSVPSGGTCQQRKRHRRTEQQLRMRKFHGLVRNTPGTLLEPCKIMIYMCFFL